MTLIYFYDFPFSWEWKIIPTDELTNSYIFQRGSSTINPDFIFVDTTSGGPAIDLTNLPENVRSPGQHRLPGVGRKSAMFSNGFPKGEFTTTGESF